MTTRNRNRINGMKTARVPHDAEKAIHPEGEERESGISIDYRNLTTEHCLDCRF
jgi:hypothetical protein